MKCITKILYGLHPWKSCEKLYQKRIVTHFCKSVSTKKVFLIKTVGLFRTECKNARPSNGFLLNFFSTFWKISVRHLISMKYFVCSSVTFNKPNTQGKARKIKQSLWKMCLRIRICMRLRDGPDKSFSYKSQNLLVPKCTSTYMNYLYKYRLNTFIL